MATTEVESISDSQIRIARVFEAPLALTYAAHTEPAHLTRWLTGPGDMKLVEATMDMRPEGSIEWRYRGPDSTEITMRGTFVEIDAPHRFVHREDWGPDLPSPLIETAFEQVDGQTMVTVTYTLPSAGMRDHVVTDGAMAEGFRISHNALDEFLSSLN